MLSIAFDIFYLIDVIDTDPITAYRRFFARFTHFIDFNDMRFENISVHNWVVPPVLQHIDRPVPKQAKLWKNAFKRSK
jgi:hypothetical protein